MKDLIKEYVMDPRTLPRDPEMAACGCETQMPLAVMANPQTAVDAARQFVQNYDGPDIPRASVTRRIKGYRNPKNAPRVIFRAWRKFDGTYMEAR